MSIFIKGMEMPKGSCEWIGENGSLRRCKLLNGDDDCKMQEGVCADATWEEQFAGCPLVEIPTPHGRLIAEKTITEIRYHDADGYHIVNGEQLCELEIDAETVIEAEGSEE